MIELSIVIPAYNEQGRLLRTLASIRRYADGLHETDIEVIVVDDGSLDDTWQLCRELQDDWSQLRLVRHRQNLGKGAAVKSGVVTSKGSAVLVMDADLSVDITESEKLHAAVSSGADVAVGSRLLPTSDSQRTLVRRVLGCVFAQMVQTIFALPVRDTQCGFKMYSQRAARHVWSNVVDQRYLADIEVLVRAQRNNFEIREVGVRYRDVPGSKLSMWRDPWKMAFSLISLRHRLGVSVHQNGC